MAANINRVVLVGNLTRDPELRHTPSGIAGLLACASRSTRAARTRPASGPTSRTTSTSPSGATRARAARSTCPRAGRSRSTAASSGASGTRRTARSARRSRSSPTTSSSSAAVTAAASGGGQFVPQGAVGEGAAADFPAAGRRRHSVLGDTDGTAKNPADAQASRLLARPRAAQELPLLQGQG